MKTTIPEDTSRKIGSRSHNRHVAEGIDAHEKTRVAPSSLLKRFDSDLKERVERRYEEVGKILSEYLGKPYYSKDSFILYKGNCVDALDRLRGSTIGIELALTSPPYNIRKEYESPLSPDEYI